MSDRAWGVIGASAVVVVLLGVVLWAVVEVRRPLASPQAPVQGPLQAPVALQETVADPAPSAEYQLTDDWVRDAAMLIVPHMRLKRDEVPTPQQMALVERPIVLYSFELRELATATEQRLIARVFNRKAWISGKVVGASVTGDGTALEIESWFGIDARLPDEYFEINGMRVYPKVEVDRVLVTKRTIDALAPVTTPSIIHLTALEVTRRSGHVALGRTV
jgi:hypothetical protein